MNTHTFDNHYVTCPICQRNTMHKPVKYCTGLFTCPYCQEKLVVCKSGHYVRDPFTLEQLTTSESLRRQSRPLARIIRDFVLLKRPAIALAVGGVIFLSTILMTQQHTSYQQQQSPGTENINETGKKIQ
jgi:hypothetical protein